MLRRYSTYQHHVATARKKFSEVQKRIIAAHQQYLCAGKTCREQKKLLPETWELDHIQPLHLGGSNFYDFTDPGNNKNNLQVLCPLCHARKTQIERINFFQCEKNHKYANEPHHFVPASHYYYPPKKKNGSHRKYHTASHRVSPYFQTTSVLYLEPYKFHTKHE